MNSVLKNSLFTLSALGSKAASIENLKQKAPQPHFKGLQGGPTSRGFKASPRPTPSPHPSPAAFHRSRLPAASTSASSPPTLFASPHQATLPNPKNCISSQLKKKCNRNEKNKRLPPLYTKLSFYDHFFYLNLSTPKTTKKTTPFFQPPQPPPPGPVARTSSSASSALRRELEASASASWQRRANDSSSKSLERSAWAVRPGGVKAVFGWVWGYGFWVVC